MPHNIEEGDSLRLRRQELVHWRSRSRMSWRPLTPALAPIREGRDGPYSCHPEVLGCDEEMKSFNSDFPFPLLFCFYIAFILQSYSSVLNLTGNTFIGWRQLILWELRPPTWVVILIDCWFFWDLIFILVQLKINWLAFGNIGNIFSHGPQV